MSLCATRPTSLTSMKFTPLHYSLLSFAFGAFAKPITVQRLDSQWPVALSDDLPTFNVNLDERRLLQFEDASEVWMTELEKIEAKARGVRFFDMLSFLFLRVCNALSPCGS